MQTIWKMALKPEDVQEISVPKGAQFLHAREQNNEVCVWYRCHTELPKEKRRIAVCGTGHSAPGPEASYLGTASLYGGELIFHVFEL